MDILKTARRLSLPFLWNRRTVLLTVWGTDVQVVGSCRERGIFPSSSLRGGFWRMSLTSLFDPCICSSEERENNQPHDLELDMQGPRFTTGGLQQLQSENYCRYFLFLFSAWGKVWPPSSSTASHQWLANLDCAFSKVWEETIQPPSTLKSSYMPALWVCSTWTLNSALPMLSSFTPPTGILSISVLRFRFSAGGKTTSLNLKPKPHSL